MDDDDDYVDEDVDQDLDDDAAEDLDDNDSDEDLTDDSEEDPDRDYSGDCLPSYERHRRKRETHRPLRVFNLKNRDAYDEYVRSHGPPVLSDEQRLARHFATRDFEGLRRLAIEEEERHRHELAQELWNDAMGDALEPEEAPGDARPDKSAHTPWWMPQPQYYRQPNESHAEYSARMVREREWICRKDAEFGEPKGQAIIRILESDRPLEEKKRAVAAWLTWARHFCEPIPPLWPGAKTIFSGCAIDCLPSVTRVKQGRLWKTYQAELAQEREARRPHRDRAEEHRLRRAAKYLDELAPMIAAARKSQDPKLTRLEDKARKRLALMNEETANGYWAHVEDLMKEAP